MDILKNILDIKILINQNLNYFLLALSFSFLNWVLASFQIWFFFKAYYAQIELINVIMLFPLAILLSLVPITPGALGIRETIFLILFSKYTFVETCIIVSVNYYLFSVFLLGIIGLFYFYKFLSKS